MTVRRPAAIACRESPICGRVLRYPASIRVFCFEDDEWWYRHSCCADALDRGYLLLPAVYNLPT
jgi:hypothetical protein